MPSKAPFNRWWVVFGAILVQLCLGAIYAWSVFTPALRDAGWSKLETQIVFGVGLASFAIVMVFAGNKLQQWGPRVLAVASGLTLGGGYLLRDFPVGPISGACWSASGLLVARGSGWAMSCRLPWACAGFQSTRG